jgi:hypothetical protein
MSVFGRRRPILKPGSSVVDEAPGQTGRPADRL